MAAIFGSRAPEEWVGRRSASALNDAAKSAAIVSGFAAVGAQRKPPIGREARPLPPAKRGVKTWAVRRLCRYQEIRRILSVAFLA